MKPPMSLLNFTPSSTALASLDTRGRRAPTDGFQRLVHGQLPATHRDGDAGPGRFQVAAVVDRAAANRGGAERAGRPVEAPGRGALRDVPRGAAIDRHFDARHDAAAVSVAVPVIVTRLPLWTCAPAAGDVMTDVGANVSVDALAAISGEPDRRRSAACGLRAHVGQQVHGRLLHGLIGHCASAPRSWMLSNPHDHCTVPAPKTSAPLACR